jgi:hypothetical protein
MLLSIERLLPGGMSIPAHQLHRSLKITYESAWFMA